MARPSIMRRFDISISDVDRNYFDTVELRLAQHPSETESFLATRILIYALHQQDHLNFSRAGLGDPSEPPLFVRKINGDFVHWFDIGCPSLDRLNKATKIAKHVTIYAYRAVNRLLDTVQKLDYDRKEYVQCFTLDPDVLSRLGASIKRTNEWSIVRTDGEVFIESNGENFQTVVEKLDD
ncbi:MAG: YaeQ family protein [Myxococcota bacterium]|nr:YaeQ family protein [Myxococcota bacterium]